MSSDRSTYVRYWACLTNVPGQVVGPLYTQAHLQSNNQCPSCILINRVIPPPTADMRPFRQIYPLTLRFLDTIPFFRLAIYESYTTLFRLVTGLYRVKIEFLRLKN